MLLRSALVILTLAALANTARAQAPEPQILEGYVFGKFTGVPLENVLVIIGYSENGSTTRARTVTDTNGFYRFDATGVEEIRIAFMCSSRRIVSRPSPTVRSIVPNPNTVEGTISLPTSWTGTLQRNVYISAPALPSFSKCELGPTMSVGR